LKIECKRFIELTAAASLLLVLVACGSSPRQPAPVEDRSAGHGTVALTEAKPMPGAENAGKPGYYTVQKGDTLTRIGLDNGQAWRDVARWNNLSNPDVIEVGQVLRVAPPGSAVESSSVVVRPVASSAAAPTTAPAQAAAKPATPSSATASEDLGFAWPANGQVVQGFDEAKNKGIDIAGKAGDPVLAAADGQVVYAGAGLRGYGNLIIVKHNNTYLTAYAHNQKLLVKEDQKVRRGDKIAEMGSSDADRVKLHFEVRKQGKPVDPAKFLASR
jgi:lipoprotein NlpD